jgi:hypothetical protein
MMVMNDGCKKCNYTCNAIYFERNFDNWTSGNNDIDKFIQDTQLTIHDIYEMSNALEWIPYDRFYNIIKDKFGKVYKANWIDGNMSHWDNIKQNWNRYNQNVSVVLKRLNNSKNIKVELMNEV